MSSLVHDPLRKNTRYGLCCHLISTETPPESTEELKKKARQLGIPATFIVEEGQIEEHFDLYGDPLMKALADGEIEEVSHSRFAEIIHEKRQKIEDLYVD